MAESTLSKGFNELRSELGRFLGYGTVEADQTAKEQAEIDQYIKDGLTSFYFHARGPGDRTAHQWSFLCPRNLFSVSPAKSLGVPDNVDPFPATSESVTVTADDAVFLSPSIVGKAAKVGTVDDSKTYSITARTDEHTFTITRDTTGTSSVSFGTEIFVLGMEAFKLPDDFAGAMNGITLWDETETNRCEIKQISVESWRQWRSTHMQEGRPQSGRPMFYAIQVLQGTTATEGQRWELLLAPAPDKDLLLQIDYKVSPPMLTDANPFPMGGAQHALTIQQACIAAAEIGRTKRTDGPNNIYYQQMLGEAVMQDRSNNRSDYIGRITTGYGSRYMSGMRNRSVGRVGSMNDTINLENLRD